MIEQLHIVVGHHDRVVHHDAERYDQARERDLVQLDPQGPHRAEGHRHGHRNRDGGDRRHRQREQQHRDQDDRDDRDHEFPHEVIDPFFHHGRLIGDQHLGHPRGEPLGHHGKAFVHLVAELDHVIAFLHFHREEDGFLAIHPDQRSWDPDPPAPRLAKSPIRIA